MGRGVISTCCLSNFGSKSVIGKGVGGCFNRKSNVAEYSRVVEEISLNDSSLSPYSVVASQSIPSKWKVDRKTC